ncbi:hypothetical protein K4K60_005250 [Colletotrichum sp. SAR11_57]|nr:hypothetical protein K4K60_005250 [Colletotrichum sp. SAR11_57]
MRPTPEEPQSLQHAARLGPALRCARAMNQHIIRHSLNLRSCHTRHMDEVEAAMHMVRPGPGAKRWSAEFDRLMVPRMKDALQGTFRELGKAGVWRYDEDGEVVYEEWAKAFVKEEEEEEQDDAAAELDALAAGSFSSCSSSSRSHSSASHRASSISHAPRFHLLSHISHRPRHSQNMMRHRVLQEQKGHLFEAVDCEVRVKVLHWHRHAMMEREANANTAKNNKE